MFVTLRNLCFLVVILMVTPSLAQLKQIIMKRGHVEAHAAMPGKPVREQPKITAEQEKRFADMLKREEVKPLTPIDPSIRPESIRPTSPPTFLKSTQQSRGRIDLPRNVGVLPSDILVSFQNRAVLTTSIVLAEPSVAVNGRVVFVTANWSAAVSGDGGESFSYLDPATRFPAVNAGFCCDQTTYYEPSRAALFWALLYSHDSSTNTVRISVARNQEEMLAGGGFYFDLTPASFGLPASGLWLDHPQLSVSSNFLYLSANVFTLNSNPDLDRPRGSVIARFPLDEMLQHESIGFAYLTVPNLQSLSCTAGATSMMYFAAHVTNALIRIYRLAEDSNIVFFSEQAHAAYNVAPTMIAPSPDGQNWATRAHDDIQGAWVSNGVIGFMWNAAQGTNFPFAQVQVLRFREADQTLLSQDQVWAPDAAWLFPSVHPNDRGHLGGTIAFGSRSDFVASMAWVADDYNPSVSSPDSFGFAFSTAGPNGWGDYMTTRRNVPYGNNWGGVGYSLQVDPSGQSNYVVRYVGFGRVRDLPPPSNTVFIDSANRSGYEDGSALHPYGTVNKGAFAATAGDTVIVRVGSYPEPLVSIGPYSTRTDTGDPSRSVDTTLRSEGGTVIVGRESTMARLRVDSLVDPQNDSGRFDVLVDGILRAIGVGRGGSTGEIQLNPGRHIVSERPAGGTVGTSYVTTISGDCRPDGSIVLNLGDDKVCTFTNFNIPACLAVCSDEHGKCVQEGLVTPAACGQQFTDCQNRCRSGQRP